MIKFIDLFCGIGGFHLAMRGIKSKCVFASEWDKNCQDVYEKNFKIKKQTFYSQQFPYVLRYILVSAVFH